MNKIKLHWINEWKIMKGRKIKTFTPLHFHIAYCNCGCHELSVFLVLLGLGFFITINPTLVEKPVNKPNEESVKSGSREPALPEQPGN